MSRTRITMKMPTPKFEFGQIVYLKVDKEDGGMVTGYLIRPNGGLVYLVTWSNAEEKDHWEIELTGEKDYAPSV